MLADEKPSPGIEDIEISPPADGGEKSAQSVRDEGLHYEKGREQKLNNDYLQVKIDQANQDRDERKDYANRLYWVMVVWLIWIAVIIWKSAANGFPMFLLSDSVLITLIGSTTASVIGVFLIVASYLFPKVKD